MENKQQTAVEWLQLEIDNKDMGEIPIWIYQFIEQAKEMEKEQIMQSYKSGNHSETRGGNVIFEKMEQYYQQTYGGNK